MTTTTTEPLVAAVWAWRSQYIGQPRDKWPPALRQAVNYLEPAPHEGARVLRDDEEQFELPGQPSDPLYHLYIRFVDHPSTEVEGNVIPRHTVYHARMVRGPFDKGPEQGVEGFDQKAYRSPIMLEWQDGPEQPPTRLMSSKEAFTSLLDMITKQLQTPDQPTGEEAPSE